MKRQFTATAYIIDNEHVLLIKHRKLGVWLPPGGHIDEGETPAEAAVREAREETGLDIELVRDENVWIEQWNATSIPRPFLCLLENIPAHGNEPAHQHIDSIFVARPRTGDLTHNHHETDGIQWFSAEEVEALESDVEIFEETKQTLRTIFASTIIQ